MTFIDTSRLSVKEPRGRRKALTAVRAIVVDHPRRHSIGSIDL